MTNISFVSKLTAADHMSSLVTSCSRSLYAVRVLRDHGLPVSSLQVLLSASVIAKLSYCAPAWSGLCSANDRARLDAFLRRCKRYGYCVDDVAVISDLFAVGDQSLFKRILTNELHVLQPSLSGKTNFNYNLRSRHHNRQLIKKTAHVINSNFIIRI